MRLRWALAASALSCAMLVAGCVSSGGSTASSSSGGKTVTVWSWFVEFDHAEGNQGLREGAPWRHR